MTVSGAGFGPLAVALKPTLSAEKLIAGRGTTSSTAVAVRALDAAVMVSRPSASPFATPVAETVATTGLLVDHAVGAPMNACPLCPAPPPGRITEPPGERPEPPAERRRGLAAAGLRSPPPVLARPRPTA